MTWTHRMLFCLLIGCGNDEEPEPKGEAGEEVVEECIPSDACCRVCAESQACGDACIASDLECSTEPGCACDAVDVCEEDSGEP